MTLATGDQVERAHAWLLNERACERRGSGGAACHRASKRASERASKRASTSAACAAMSTCGGGRGVPPHRRRPSEEARAGDTRREARGDPDACSSVEDGDAPGDAHGDARGTRTRATRTLTRPGPGSRAGDARREARGDPGDSPSSSEDEEEDEEEEDDETYYDRHIHRDVLKGRGSDVDSLEEMLRFGSDGEEIEDDEAYYLRYIHPEIMEGRGSDEDGPLT